MAPYQHKREPLSEEETNVLANACEGFQEKLVVWTLLDTGLRVSEFAALTSGDMAAEGITVQEVFEWITPTRRGGQQNAV